MTETYVKEEVARRTMVKVPLPNSFLQRRVARRKFSESLGAGAPLTPRTRQRIPLGSENDWTSPRMPGNHVHGNGLPATFVPGRRNVCKGYWVAHES